jgi:RND family efflux transporter MFP subunit
MKKFLLVLTAVLVVAAGAGLVGWQATQPRLAEAAIPVAEPVLPVVTVGPAHRTEVVETVAVTGTLIPRNEVLAGPEIEGLRIIEILVEEGDVVNAGDVLVRLSRDTIDAQLAQSDAALARADAGVAQANSQIAQAQANAALARADLGRAQTLIRSGASTQAVVDQRAAAEQAASAQLQAARDALRASEAERRSVEAQRRELQLRLARTQVRTPAGGLVARRNAKLGAVASAAGEPLFRIIENAEIELEAEAPEARLAALAPGQKAVVHLAGGARVEGRVRLVSPEIDRATRLGRVRIALSDPKGARIGAFARAEIEIRRERSVTAPASAIIHSPEGVSVLVAQNGSVRQRFVKLGHVDGVRAEIRSGVEEGEEIVLRAGAFLRDGDAVRAVQAPSVEARR